MGRYKSRELVHFGVDYVRATLTRGKNIHRKLRLSSNSNICAFDRWTIIEKMPSMSTEFRRFYQIRDNATNATLCFIGLEGIKKGAITRSDFLEITGQGLKLRGGLGFFVKMLERLDLVIDKYIRVDVCMDINVDTDYFLREIVGDKFKRKTTTPFITKGVYNALYVGEKQFSKNTYQFLRIYNKKLDTIKKEKGWLYLDYAEFSAVTRLEVEIRRDKAQYLTTEKLLSVDYLFGICVSTFYSINNQFFSFLHLEDFRKVEKEAGIWIKRLEKQAERKRMQEVYGNDFKNDDERRRWMRTYIAYAKKLYSNGVSFEKLVELLELNIDKADKNSRGAVREGKIFDADGFAVDE